MRRSAPAGQCRLACGLLRSGEAEPLMPFRLPEVAREGVVTLASVLGATNIDSITLRVLTKERARQRRKRCCIQRVFTPKA